MIMFSLIFTNILQDFILIGDEAKLRNLEPNWQENEKLNDNWIKRTQVKG